MASVLMTDTHQIDDDLVEHRTDVESMAPDPAKDLVQFFKLLADETRLKILFFLFRRGELNVRTLCGLLRQSQPAVSHHLALLRVDGLIDCRRDGKHNYYRLLPDRINALVEILSEVTSGENRYPGFLPVLRRQPADLCSPMI